VLFEAVHSHPAKQCPMLSAEGKAMVKKLFSPENMKENGINMVAAYLSCPQDSASDHKGFFTIEAADTEAVKKFFGAMAVEVRPVKPLSEIAKNL
jgi:hypothetical protein